MAQDYVSLKQLAETLGMDRSHVRRYVLRHGLQPHMKLCIALLNNAMTESMN